MSQKIIEQFNKKNYCITHEVQYNNLQKKNLAVRNIKKIEALTNNHLPQLLLVDDDKFTLAIEKAIFQNDYHISLAKNGCEALEILKQEKINIVLTDINMPHMSGLELAQAIRSLANANRNVLIIGISASQNKELIQKCLASGMQTVMAKPVTKKEILKQFNQEKARQLN